MARAQKFDLILLDLNLPRLNGTEVLRRLNMDGMLRDTPVIVITSLSNVEETKEALDLGAEDYLPKPFNTRLLQDRINACLEKRRLAALLQSEISQRENDLIAVKRLQAAWATGGAPSAGVLLRPGVTAAASIVPGTVPGGGFVEVISLPAGLIAMVAGHAGKNGVAGALDAAWLRSMVRKAFDERVLAGDPVDAPELMAALQRDWSATGILASLFISIAGALKPSLSWAMTGAVKAYGINAQTGVSTSLPAAIGPGDQVLAFSHDPAFPVLDEPRLRACLANHEAVSANALRDRILAELTAEAEGLSTDVALLVLGHEP
jgi:CheY-like chemotaxis protein